MEKVRGLPGFGPDCKKCTLRLPDDYPSIRYPCGAFYFTDLRGSNGTFEITSDSEGNSFTCDSYEPNLINKPNLITRFREGARSFRARFPLIRID